jgi:hypothetical protein
MVALAASALAVVPPATPVLINVECTLCDVVVPILAHLIANNEPNIESKMDAVCDQALSWSGAIDTACKSFINSNLDEIVAEINAGTEVGIICAKLNACPSMTMLAKQVKPVAVAQTKNLKCTVCTGLVFFIEGLGSVDEPTIKSKLDTYCAELPFQALASACTTLVDTDLDTILKELENHATPQEVCQSLSLCENMRAATFVAKQRAAFKAQAIAAFKARVNKPVKV